MNIYCDEAGFTGNHLLDAEQDIFAYASVAIRPSEADDLVKSIRKKFRLNANELKGSTLIKQARGQQAVTEILKELQGKFLFVAHLKVYALAAKLFEYIFEPAFSDCNSIYYDIDFHRFISTLLFVSIKASDRQAEKILEDFEKYARSGKPDALAAMFPPMAGADYENNPLHAVGLFAELHRDEIKREIEGFREPGVPNWILDLTTTSLYHILTAWGEKYKTLKVTCDEAKPLKGDMLLFDAMVGQESKGTFNFQGKEQPLFFNLSEPLILSSSKDVPGLQIADIIATCAASVWKSSYRGCPSPIHGKWFDLLITGAHEDNHIWPDLSHMDITKPEAFANTIVLQELINRSLKKEDLCDGIRWLYYRAIRLHPKFLMDSGLAGKPLGAKKPRRIRSV